MVFLALFNLAVCYEEGIGCPQNLLKAVKNYKIASHLGDAAGIKPLWLKKCLICDFLAKFNLALCFENGIGCPKDVKKAFHLYKQASLSGESTG